MRISFGIITSKKMYLNKSLCKNILTAYQHIHSLGVLHGDVNLRNILVSPGGRVSIIDFALSVTGNTARPGSRPGVVFFMNLNMQQQSFLENSGRPLQKKLSNMRSLHCFITCSLVIIMSIFY